MKDNIKLSEEDIEVILMVIKNAIKKAIIDIGLRDDKEPWGLIKGGSPDKFADLKEAYERGEDIEIYSPLIDLWVCVESPSWFKTRKYRIRPLQIGDWLFNGKSELVRMDNKDEISMFCDTLNIWKRITDKELINKLNNL